MDITNSMMTTSSNNDTLILFYNITNKFIGIIIKNLGAERYFNS